MEEFFSTLLGSILTLLLKVRCQFHAPQNSGSITLRGLNSRVDITRDHLGIPSFFARDMHDLLFAQGFVHAQDRLWQMDFQRRVVSGRLSEIFGKRTLEVDRWMRTLGLRRAAERDATNLGRPMRLELEAYSEGVNAFIDRGRLPIEFSLLRYTPDCWTATDILSWNKMMSWSLSVNWESELIRAALIEKLGEENERELEPVYFDYWPIIIPDRTRPWALKRNGMARPYTGPGPGDGIGSNCWVVAGFRTITGSPLLASDMHLFLGIPSIWYENQLVCGSYTLTGITAPGVPNILAGHNGRVAWGFTAGLSDVQDLYIERIRHDSDGNVRYEYEGHWYEVDIIEEKIGVKGGKTETERVIITNHGPVINRLAPQLAGEKPIALRWTAFEPDTTPKGVYEMLRAHNCTEFHEALRCWITPNVNVLYADVEGNIGYTHTGKIPIRRRGKGLIPVPGWSGEYEWDGFIPFEELPHLYNPPEGYIVSANNRVAGGDYPYFLGAEYCAGDRAERILDMINSREMIDLEYMKEMQRDLLSPTARRITHLLKPFLEKCWDGIPEVLLLKDWDGTLARNSASAALYQAFIRSVIPRILNMRLGDLTEHYMGKGVKPIMAEHSMFCWRSWEWLQKELAADDSSWTNRDREEILLEAFREAVELLKTRLGDSVQKWTWGKLHTLTLVHPLGRVKLLGKFFNRGPYTVGGDGTTIWASYSNMHDLDSRTIIGPPSRFIVDLGALDNTLGVLIPGQSGNPASSHYDDQIESWFRGEYHRLPWSASPLDEEVRWRLVLSPPHYFP